MSPLIFFSSALGLIGPAIYIVSILKGKARPHRTTRLVLFVIGALGTLSFFLTQDYANFTLFIFLSLANLVLLLLSFKYGMGGWSKIDVTCLFIALTGIIVWQITDNPLIALYASVIADCAGFIPALLKTYKYPETEIWLFYFCDLLASILIIIAHKNITLNQSLYPVYLIVVNTLMIIFIFRPKITQKG